MNSRKTISDLFLKRVKKFPYLKSVGTIQNSEILSLTFKQLEDKVALIAKGLSYTGMEKGDKVAILSHSSLNWHLVDIATMCSGCVTVPIYPTYIENEVSYILKNSESSFLVIENNYQFKKFLSIQSELIGLKAVISFNHIKAELLEQARKDIDILTLDELISKGEENTSDSSNYLKDLSENIDENEIASIIYTSGTTGEPKGAVITHASFYRMLDNLQSFLFGNIDNNDKTLTFLPLSHVLGRCDSMLYLALGNQTIFAQSIEKLASNIKIAQPSLIIGVPRIFEKFYAKITSRIAENNFIESSLFDWATLVSEKYFSKIEKDLSPSTIEIVQRELAYKLVFKKIYDQFGGKVRFLVSGGAPLSTEIQTFFKQANLPILEGYGLTETIGPCSLNPIAKQITGTVGVPIGDVQIGFADDGEILIKSESLFKGYYKNEEATKESFKDGWYHTGDIGKLTREGYLKITDRKKDIIITSGGKNVSPQKIENLMKTQPYISNFMVVGDKRKFLTGIVSIEKEDFVEVIEALDLEMSSPLSDFANNPKVRELVAQSINSVNEKLARYETIKKFYISPLEFSLENGLITPSMKLKKKAIYSKFNSEINALYNGQ